MLNFPFTLSVLPVRAPYDDLLVLGFPDPVHPDACRLGLESSADLIYNILTAVLGVCRRYHDGVDREVGWTPDRHRVALLGGFLRVGGCSFL